MNQKLQIDKQLDKRSIWAVFIVENHYKQKRDSFESL